MIERCEDTELPIDTCACPEHRNIKDDISGIPPGGKHSELTKTINHNATFARMESPCSLECGKQIEPLDEIVRENGGWAHVECAYRQ